MSFQLFRRFNDVQIAIEGVKCPGHRSVGIALIRWQTYEMAEVWLLLKWLKMEEFFDARVGPFGRVIW
jgi:hypothetical protein